jgi:NAD(P)-dependent dehydrogenase (short-subunit alcohol dehydrogenase family)
MSLASRVALVTGGGRGIGAAIARRLAADGARVIVTGRSAGEIDAVARELGGVALRADLTDRASTDALIEAVRGVGRVDILVNNAGIAESAPLAKVSDEAWDRIMETNATAPFRLCRALIPAMVAAGWGRVINLASNAGVSGYGYSAAYCASKHALVGFTRAMAVDLAKTGVTINAVCPGWVDTNMVTEATDRIAAKTGRSSGEAREALAKMSPQGRILPPEEVAHVVAMLASELSRGIHGQAIVIDGGQVLK